jgi:hypothetical protein
MPLYCCPARVKRVAHKALTNWCLAVQDTATSKGTSTDDLDVEFALSLALMTNSSERVRSALTRALTADRDDLGVYGYMTTPAVPASWSASPYSRLFTLVRASVGHHAWRGIQ